MQQRILSGIVFGVVFIGLGWCGGIWLSLGLGGLLCLAALEFGRLCRAGAFRLSVMVPAGIGLATLLAITTRLRGETTLAQVRGVEPILALSLIVLFMATAIAEVWRGQTRGALTAAGLTVLAGVYISFPLAYMLMLRSLPGKEGLFYFFLLTIVTWANDTVAYFAGSAFGRHRLAPSISPKKSVEGSAAGLIASVMAGLIFAVFWGRNPWPCAGIGLGVGLFGQIGDLFESIIKRDLGVKDSGNFLPGHGGVLDRFDSLIFSAPIVYYLAVFLGG
ncbi:MAG: phosphatidate cytidylyltransferase [Bacteroidota bacterium]